MAPRRCWRPPTSRIQEPFPITTTRRATSALPAFVAAALAGYTGCKDRCEAWREKVTNCFTNILETTDFATPEGSYHESMDYMRITWASPDSACRTCSAPRPASIRRITIPCFATSATHISTSCFPMELLRAKATMSIPILDARDTSVIGYAVNRFKDPLQRMASSQERLLSRSNGRCPCSSFSGTIREVTPRDPALASESELPRQRFFPASDIW